MTTSRLVVQADLVPTQRQGLLNRPIGHKAGSTMHRFVPCIIYHTWLFTEGNDGNDDDDIVEVMDDDVVFMEDRKATTANTTDHKDQALTTSTTPPPASSKKRLASGIEKEGADEEATVAESSGNGVSKKVKA